MEIIKPKNTLKYMTNPKSGKRSKSKKAAKRRYNTASLPINVKINLYTKQHQQDTVDDIVCVGGISQIEEDAMQLEEGGHDNV